MEEDKKDLPAEPLQSKVVTLQFPLTHPDGTIIEELILRRLKAKELKTVAFKQGDEMNAMLKLVAIMTALPEKLLDELDATDALNVCSEAAPFLGGGIGQAPFR